MPTIKKGVVFEERNGVGYSVKSGGRGVRLVGEREGGSGGSSGEKIVCTGEDAKE